MREIIALKNILDPTVILPQQFHSLLFGLGRGWTSNMVGRWTVMAICLPRSRYDQGHVISVLSFGSTLLLPEFVKRGTWNLSCWWISGISLHIVNCSEKMQGGVTWSIFWILRTPHIDSCDHPSLAVFTHWYLLSTIVSCDHPLLPVITHWYLWSPIVSCDHPLLPVITHWYLWSPIVSCDHPSLAVFTHR